VKLFHVYVQGRCALSEKYRAKLAIKPFLLLHQLLIGELLSYHIAAILSTCSLTYVFFNKMIEIAEFSI